MAQTAEIIEGNKLIAEFMGGKKKYYSISNTEYYLLPDGRKHMTEHLKYHQCWDNFLMPVVEKIKDTVLVERPYENLLDKLDVLNLYITAPIQTVWEQCIYAIKLLNTAK